MRFLTFFCVLSTSVVGCFISKPCFSGEGKGPEKNVSLVAIETPIEKMHRPLIEAPAAVKEGNLFWITIKVGEKPHPMRSDHHVEWIQGSINPESHYLS